VKKLISILFLFTLLLQAIPVFHFFSERSEIFYTSLDEDKPEETKVEKAKKEIKAQLFGSPAPAGLIYTTHYFTQSNEGLLPSPYVESLIRPPDAAC
jgi:hypothetical protein